MLEDLNMGEVTNVTFGCREKSNVQRMGYQGIAVLSNSVAFPSAVLIELCFHLLICPTHGHAIHYIMAISFPLPKVRLGVSVRCNYGQEVVKGSILGVSGGKKSS